MADRYVVLRKINRSGNDFSVGTPIALEPSEAAPLIAIGAIEAQAGALPAMPEAVSRSLGNTLLGDQPAAGSMTTEQIVDAVATAFVHGGHTNVTVTYDDPGNRIIINATAGASLTAEDIQDAMGTALAHSGHSGCSVAYDDAANRFVITVTAGGSGAPVFRKINVTANTVVATVVLAGYGTAGQLAAAAVAASADGSTITVSGLDAAFKLTGVQAHTPAGFNTATAFSLVFPDPGNAASTDDAALPILMHWNAASPAVEQAQTNINVAVSNAVITLQKTGLVGGTGARWKAIL